VNEIKNDVHSICKEKSIEVEVAEYRKEEEPETTE